MTLLLAATACASPDQLLRDSAADTLGANASTPGTSSPQGDATSTVLGACCPDGDSALYALMDRYERTPERERAPEVALWPYRMTSGITSAERIVVRDSASWAALWPRIVGTHSPRPNPPAVNFATEMLIVASMGRRSSGGYVVAIDSVQPRNDTLHVAVREQSPGPRCGTTAALSAPVALARVRRSELPVHFTTRNVVRDCP